MEELAKYGASGVAVAALLAIYWIIKGFLSFLKESEKRHCEAYDKLDETIKENSRASALSVQSSKETLTFMKGLNGNLKRAYQDKVAGR
jgi:hypothetical protein